MTFPSTPPAGGVLAPWTFPETVQVQVPGGPLVVAVRMGVLPIVQLRWCYRGGTYGIAPGLEGLAGIWNSTARHGTRKYESAELAQVLDHRGIRLRFSTGLESTTVAISTLSQHFDWAVDLLDEVAFGPTFPEHHVARERAKALEVLHHQLSVPGYLAGLWLNHAVYGGHPYGRRSSTLEGLKAVTRQDVQGFHERIMAPGSSRGMLLVVGDVDPHAVAHRLARRWENGDLDGAATIDAEQVASKPLEGLGFPVPEPQIIAVDRPESEQVTFGIGHQTIPRAHPDYYALRVANQVFGGGASSRLFMTLREQRSLTYGVYSRLSAGTRGGELSAEMATALDKAEEAAEALMNEFRGICASPISAEELTMAKQYLVGAFPRRASGVGGVASLVMMARNHGFGLEQWAEHQARIAAVDLDEVHAVTQRWIRPEALSVVAVGPGELCARALAPLGRVEVKGVGAVPPCSV